MNEPFSRHKTISRIKIGCLGAALLIGGIMIVGLITLMTETPDHGEHVNRVEWLPTEATDVSFYRSYGWTAYEFSISDAGFKAWASEHGWPVQQYELWPTAIGRYHFMVRRDPAASLLTTRPADASDHFETTAMKLDYKAPARGWFYRHEQSNGGGVWIGYDLEEKRAYFHSSPR